MRERTRDCLPSREPHLLAATHAEMPAAASCPCDACRSTCSQIGLDLLLSALSELGREVPDEGQDTTAFEAPMPAQLGDFRILRVIARGGMGAVYEAEQTSLCRRVALKVIATDYGRSVRRQRRFRNEALAAARLEHPHIVPIYAWGCANGVYYYAMQQVVGSNLADLIARMRFGGGPLTSLLQAAPSDCGAESISPVDPSVRRVGSRREYHRIAAFLAMQAAEALQHAHEQGVVHRDVKPSNLLVDRSGRLFVADFGLAACENVSPLSDSGLLAGTLRYAAPERLAAPRQAARPTSDIYALGVTLYELLALQPAFDASSPANLVAAITHSEPIALRRRDRSLPAGLAAIVAKAMERDPRRRYSSAADLSHDLQRFLADRSVSARLQPVVVRAIRGTPRKVGLLAIGLMLTLALVAALKVGPQQQRLTHDEQRDAVNDAEASDWTQPQHFVDHVVEELSRGLHGVPGGEVAHHAVLEDAVRFYKELLDRGGDDDRLRLAASAAYRRLATLHVQLGEADEPARSLDQARSLVLAVRLSRPRQESLRYESTRMEREISRLFANAGLHASAFDCVTNAVRELACLAVEHPDATKYRHALAECLWEAEHVSGGVAPKNRRD